MKGDQVLMVKRNFPPWAGDWSIIQGLVEPGELIDEAVKREVREETGVEVEVEGVIAMRHMIYDWKGETRSEVYTVFLTNWRSGEPRPDGIETEAVRFVSLNELVESDLLREPARKMLGKFLGERRVLTRTDTELWRSLEYIRQQVLYA